MSAASPISAAARSSSTSLRRLLEDRAKAEEITRFLEGMPGPATVEEVLGLRGKEVKHLYHAMAGGPPVTLDELVPPDTKGTLIYEGRNSLPAFSRFQKRFTRVDGAVIGYNHQTMSFVTGPGYFLVRDASGEGEHATELLFDYTAPPPAEPAGWPKYKPNDAGLSRAVYANMHDYVRRVARGVVVGRAYKLGVDQKAYFLLARAV